MTSQFKNKILPNSLYRLSQMFYLKQTSTVDTMTNILYANNTYTKYILNANTHTNFHKTYTTDLDMCLAKVAGSLNWRICR